MDLAPRPYPYMEEVNAGIVREFEHLLPTRGRALDVGCGRGQLGGAVRALGWDVWGVEEAEEACVVARKRLNAVITADLNDQDAVWRGLGDQRFDALIFSDVLEHVYDPLGVLVRYLDLVKPGGRVFISLPNAVVWTNRLQWFLGRVRYEDTGVMDRTHIRFFTFDTAKELVTAAGCAIESVSCTPYLVRAALPVLKKVIQREAGASPDPRALIDSSAFKRYMKSLYPAERAIASAWPGLLAFRIIVVCRKAEDGATRSVHLSTSSSENPDSVKRQLAAFA